MHTVDQHFERTEPHVYAIYEKIVKAARKFGPVVEDPKKTSIHLNRRTAFAGIATRKTAIIITLKAPSDIDDARIVKHQHTSAARWYLDVRLEQPRDVDALLLRWLEQSYALAE